MDCIFCKIVMGIIPTRIIKETSNSISFLDAFPLARGHVLVISKKHHQKIQDMTTEENNDLFSLVHHMLSKLDSFTGSTLVAVHNGKDAGQEIPHVHVHLVPRDKNDSAGPIHEMFEPSLNLSDADLNDLYLDLKE